jgi:hypothetical protein
MTDSVWKVLSAIDCSEHVEKKGQFSYLAWTWAWAMVKERYPNARYELLDDTVYPDGSMEVRVSVVISGTDSAPLEHTMWLPVLDFKNKAIKSPNAFDINSSRMRCLVKCLAMFGLGHYIYAGESLPTAPVVEATEDQRQELLSILAAKDGTGLIVFVKDAGTEVMDSLFNSAPKGQKSRFKQEVRDLYADGNKFIKSSVEAIQLCLDTHSVDGLNEVMEEMSDNEKLLVNAALTETEKHQIETLEKQA